MPILEIVKTQVEKITIRIKDLTKVLRERNHYYDRFIVMVKRQASMAKNKLKLLKEALQI